MNTIFYNDVYIKNKYSVIHNQYNPITLSKADYVVNKFYYKNKSVEETESYYQSLSIKGLINKEKIKKADLFIASDLQNQLCASSFNACKNNIAFLGIYSACSSFAEGLIIAASFMNHYKNIIVAVSSHNLVNEKQFRFPIEYGAVRKKVNSHSSTGAVSCLISKEGKLKIECTTIGKAVDSLVKDANNMGSAMAKGVVDTLHTHLMDTKRSASYYDLILIGDCGKYGLEVIKDYYISKYDVSLDNIEDAGYLLFSNNKKFKYAGGSGPVCQPFILFDYINTKKYKKILLISSGSLHSCTSCNLNKTIPVISHAISLEVQ
ncbi:MAG: hypothetical protein RR984_00195 [Bacilli bacterium]